MKEYFALNLKYLHNFMFLFKLFKIEIFYPPPPPWTVEAVDRDSETQLQVGKQLQNILISNTYLF